MSDMGWYAWTAIGTLALVFSATGVALWQHSAAPSVRRGAREDKATLVVIDGCATRDSVTIRNLSSTPVNWVAVGATCIIVDKAAGLEYAGLGVARVDPFRVDLIAPNETKTFSFPEWKEEIEGYEIAAENLVDRPTVRFSYRDAAGARWERENHDRPKWVGGTPPLPGQAMAQRRLALRWKARHKRRSGRGWARAES